MISLLENGYPPSADQNSDEEQLISLIYRFANKKEEWFNLLLSLSNCLSISDSLPDSHPYKDVSKRLLLHLKNALSISSQLHSSAKHIDAPSVLNHIPMGAMIIDIHGRIIEINQLAQTLIERTEKLNINQDYLHITQGPSLKDIISDLQTEQSLSINSLHLNLRNQQGKPHKLWGKNKSQAQLKLHITEIPQSENQALPSHFYLCFQSSNDNFIRTEYLKKHYALTETEALVVSTLVNELSSQGTANKLKLKEATIRGHLTNIYQKLGVSRKPELIRKVLLHSLVTQPDSSTQQLQTNHRNSAHESHSYAIYLRDGRKLSYAEHYPAKTINKDQDKPVENILLLHNLMGSAYELPPVSMDLLTHYNLRIIVPERPGYGDSDPQPNRSHKDWCEDIRELLDNLKIDQVKLIAHSIGGVYALAMSQYLPERVSRIAMVNAMPRVCDIVDNDQPTPVLVTALLRSLRFAPFLIEPILKMAVGKDIEHFYEQQLSYIRPTREGRAADINLLKTSSYRHYSIANLKQSAKQGIKIWADELRLSFAELDFGELNQSIQYQFWHGAHDDVIPVDAALNLAKQLNTQSFHRIETETHFLFARQFPKIIEQLINPVEQYTNLANSGELCNELIEGASAQKN